MKNKNLEAKKRRMREYHKHHQWRLSSGCLYIPHAYWHMTPESLSGWDDVGFIINGCRYIVWWQHPRTIYRDAIEIMAFEEAGEGPDPASFDSATALYKNVGKARRRKKHMGHRFPERSEEQKAYYAQVKKTIDQITIEGIDMEIRPSWTWKRLNQGMSVSLVAPIEVRNERELVQLADLSKLLVQQKTTLATEFPEAVYNRASWFLDQDIEKKLKNPKLPV